MNIGTLGFPEDQRVKLGKILSLSRNNRYELVDFDPAELPDLLLIFGSELLESAPVSELPEAYHARIIIVDKDKIDSLEYSSIGYPMVSSRVLRALDKMTNENEELDADETTGDVENKFEKYAQTATDLTQTATETGGRQFKVLVVDDSEAMQQALITELTGMEQTVVVTTADDGEQALAAVESTTFDFIFLDIVMPGIDGFEVCTQMRARPELKKTPIIMLSSRTSPLDEVKGIMAGCSTYLTKPIEHVEFQKVIQRVTNWIEEFKAS
ncbi:MAG: response regulator [Pontibacterium sp.]